MEINWKENMNEIGGAFMLTWVVGYSGMGVEWAVCLAVLGWHLRAHIYYLWSPGVTC